jgi:DNA polymerase-3 subunit delta
MAGRESGGAQLLARVERELAAGWPVGLTVLTGDDLYHLDRAQRLLLERLAGEDTGGFGLTVFGGDEKVDVAEVVAAARSVGMFAERRVVFVRDVGALEGEPDALVNFAESPPQKSHVLVRAPTLDKRRKLHQALDRRGRKLDFAAGPGGAGVADVRRMGREHGLDVDPAAAALLAELAGFDLYRLDGELAKLAAWIGGTGGRADVEAVRAVAASGGLLSGFELADAVLRRDRAAGLAAARALVRSGEEAVRIVGGVAWRSRVAREAKALELAGRRPRDVVERLRSAYYFRDALELALARYSMGELLAFPAALAEADRTLKSRSIAPSVVLERLVDRLTGAAPRG